MIEATGIPSSEAFGSASIGVILEGNGITSAEAFGAATVTSAAIDPSGETYAVGPTGETFAVD